ncbi:MAG: hypothetical protein LBK95_20760 [Bifidobacteriaceae bacterium]|jgi:hypothetical protein|nr:hypothetical protein [Bifidobacteriaceae bacterium]
MTERRRPAHESGPHTDSHTKARTDSHTEAHAPPDAGLAAAALERIAHDQERFRHLTTLNDRFVLVVLGAAYLLGFGGQYLATVVWPSSAGQAGLIAAAAGSCGVFVILTHAWRRYEGVRGSAATRPVFFGVAWLIGLVLVLAVTALVASESAGAQTITRVAYSTSCVLVGLTYACAGVFVSGRRDLVLGFWLIGVGVASGLTPWPTMLAAVGALPALGFWVSAATWPRGRLGAPSNHG